VFVLVVLVNINRYAKFEGLDSPITKCDRGAAFKIGHVTLNTLFEKWSFDIPRRNLPVCQTWRL